MAGLTRKHFNKLAEILYKNGERVEMERLTGRMVIESIGEDIMEWCEQENPNFDRGRFIAEAAL